jgi:hypothetical protein
MLFLTEKGNKKVTGFPKNIFYRKLWAVNIKGISINVSRLNILSKER